jgi:hypothetical protein
MCGDFTMAKDVNMLLASSLHHLEVQTIRDGYADICRRILENGDDAAPRGKRTKEITGFSIHCWDPGPSLPTGTGRNLHSPIAAVEALQLIGGVLDPDALLSASYAFKEFMDGGTFHGGYGQRVRGQIPAVVERLRSDRDSRRAVLNIWDPLHDLFVEGVNDYPCTLSIQFMLRRDTLEMHVNMRSNDVWRGLAYDAFVFTQLQHVIAAALNVQTGAYTHHVGSMHVYEENWDDVMKLHEPNEAYTGPHNCFVKDGTKIEHSMEIARYILASRGDVNRQDVICTNEDARYWYYRQMGRIA